MYYTEDSNISDAIAQSLSRTGIYITHFEYKQYKDIFSNKIEELFGIHNHIHNYPCLVQTLIKPE